MLLTLTTTRSPPSSRLSSIFGYQIERASMGPYDPEVGAPTLVAVFDRREARLAVPGQPSGLSPS